MDLLISRIAEILKDEILKSGIRRKEGETELRILVQSSQAGAIIGTKGTTVKTLREVCSILLPFLDRIRIGHKDTKIAHNLSYSLVVQKSR